MRKLIEKWLGIDKLAKVTIEQHLKIQELEIRLLKLEIKDIEEEIKYEDN